MVNWQVTFLTGLASEQCLVKLKQCCVDIHHVIIPRLDEEPDDDIKLAAVG